MNGKILTSCLLLLGLLLSSPVQAQIGDLILEEGGLPSGVVNTVQPEFGKYPLAGDYGLGNVTPIETVGQGAHQEIRVLRTPPLRMYRYHAQMQVLLGNVKGVHVWIETPPSQGHWNLSVSVLYMDGTSRSLFSKDLNRGVRNWVEVTPHTRLDLHLYTKTRAVKVDRGFVLVVSPPEFWSRFPELLPVPYKTYFP